MTVATDVPLLVVSDTTTKVPQREKCMKLTERQLSQRKEQKKEFFPKFVCFFFAFLQFTQKNGGDTYFEYFTVTFLHL